MKNKIFILPALAALIFTGIGFLVAQTSLPDNAPVTYVAPLEMSKLNLASGGTLAFRGDYVRGTWDGNFYAYNVSAAGAISTPIWDAHSTLAAKNFDTGRIIVTRNGTSGAPFRWASISTAQKALLGDAVTGPITLNYTRGDSSNETPAAMSLRKRLSKLGDVVHSRPYYYAHSGTQKMVYVGANDGMLHAFDVSDGTEKFAYVPSMIMSKLKQISLSTYVISHVYTVDGQIGIAPVGAKTVLVGGLGGGGKGLYALDITNPAPANETAASAMSLWEITAADAGFGNLGYTFGSPQIYKLNNGQQAVLMPNGFYSGTGKATLLVIDAATGAKLGEIDTGVGSTATPNGLGSYAAIDTDGNGTVDKVFAGDLQGNLWKFDLAASTSSGWTVNKVITTSPARPITAAPSVMYHPQGGYMVNFGTGRMLVGGDELSTDIEYIYGVWDGAPGAATAIIDQTLTQVTGSFGNLSYDLRVSSNNPVVYGGATSKKGWKIALPAGERLIGEDTFSDSGRYVVTTQSPNASGTIGGMATKGKAWLMQLDALTGAEPVKSIMDLDLDGKFTDADKVSVSGTARVPIGKFLGYGAWSQPIAGALGNFDIPYFNTNPNIAFPVYPPSVSSGIDGGHFDYDIYYNVCNPSNGYSCTSNTHKHEYDDIYNVTGVNMLNASLPAFNLTNAISSNTTKFKILVANQRMSPAAGLMIAGTQYLVRDFQVDGNLTGALAAQGTGYTTATVGKFQFELPLDAFTSKDWGTGEVRAGLVPSKTGCVRSNQGATGTQPGPWMNGALTFQIIKADTPTTAIELNIPGDVKMGFRLKRDTTSQSYQLAQYTTFWHHPNGFCVGDAGWIPNPPPDNSPTSPGSAPAGTDDPKGGTFTSSGTVVGGSSVTVNGVPGTVVDTYNLDGSITRTIRSATGTILDQRTLNPGNTSLGPNSSRRQARYGRLSWQELIRN